MNFKELCGIISRLTKIDLEGIALTIDNKVYSYLLHQTKTVNELGIKNKQTY